MQKREALGREVIHQELERHIDRQAYFLDSDKEKQTAEQYPSAADSLILSPKSLILTCLSSLRLNFDHAEF